MNQTVSIFIFPLIFTLIIVSEPLIITLLSEKWIASIQFFQLLCLANIFTPFFGLNISALNSRGESKRTLQLELIKKGLILTSIFLCFSFGIVAMLMGFVFANFIAFVVSMVFIKKSLTYSIRQQFSDIFPTLSFSILVSFVLYFSQKVMPENHVMLLLLQLGLALIIYLGFLFVFKKDLFEKGVAKIQSIIVKK